MKKIVFTVIALLALAVVASGCLNKSGTAYMYGDRIKWKIGSNFTTLVVDGNFGLMAATETFYIDGYGNVTEEIPGGNGTFYRTTDLGINYIRFFIWPEKYAITSYAGTYFYGGCSVMSYNNAWQFKCNHPIDFFHTTATPTDWFPYQR